MHKRNVLSSPRLAELKKQRRNAVVRKFLILLFAVAVLFTTGTYLSKVEGLNISSVEISGNKVVETNLIKTSVEEQITGKYIWLFPKTNVLFYPKGTIKATLQKNFSRLGKIDLSVRDRKILVVSVSEREALYMWCGEIPPIETLRLEENKCYFLDNEGYIFDEAPFFSGEVYFKFYGALDNNAAENPIGSYFSGKNFKQLVLFKDVVSGMGTDPVMISVLPDGDIEMFLARNDSNTAGPKIIFESEADLEKVAENLQAALATEPLLSGFKNKYSSLLYIDLRFGNKVYFKFLPASGGQ
ncbi:MAG: hypothetical protein WAV15_04280 [Minisyncoccia bacterium]